MWWLLSALGLNTLIGFVVGFKLNNRLRCEHSDTWIALGQPQFLNNSILNQWRSAKFYLFSEKYKQLSDPIFDKLVLAIRIINVIQLALLACGIILVKAG